MPTRVYDHSVETKGPRTTLNDAVIEALDLEEALRIWRYAPSGQFQVGDPTTNLFIDKLMRLRRENEKAWERLTKQIGF